MTSLGAFRRLVMAGVSHELSPPWVGEQVGYRSRLPMARRVLFSTGRCLIFQAGQIQTSNAINPKGAKMIRSASAIFPSSIGSA